MYHKNKNHKDVEIKIEDIPTLISQFFDYNWRINQKAIYKIQQIAIQYPQCLYPYLLQMLQMVKQPGSEGHRRNVLRTWQYIQEFPEEQVSNIYQVCFDHLKNTKTAIASRVFSMTVCYNISLKYPELQDELATTIQLHLTIGSPGFKNRATKILTLIQGF